tara:strand:+ start:2379 stop:2957 length:579 start_codon:yes stop_codon:yes gene_type:complete
MKKFCIFLSAIFFARANQSFGSEAGMPQLNPEFWPSQIFWLILTFSALYLIIWKIFLPKITYSIENRKSKIVNDLNEAQKLKETAEKKLNEYKKIIENSKIEAQKIIENSKKKLERDISDKKLKFNEEIEKELEAVEKEINNFKDKSVTNIKKISSEISTDLVMKIANTQVNQSNVSAIVDEIIKNKIKRYI